MAAINKTESITNAALIAAAIFSGEECELFVNHYDINDEQWYEVWRPSKVRQGFPAAGQNFDPETYYWHIRVGDREAFFPDFINEFKKIGGAFVVREAYHRYSDGELMSEPRPTAFFIRPTEEDRRRAAALQAFKLAA